MTSGDILERLGLTAAALSGGSLSVRSPIDGAEIARIRETPAADMPAIIDRAHNAFLAWREVPGAEAGRARPPARRGIARLEGGLGRAGDARGRQDRLRGPGRSAGDDRHLRLRRRPLAPIVRSRHRLGASGPSHDRDLASDGAVRDHFRLQFSGRGLVLERGAGARLRRSGDLEAVREDAALGAGDDEDPRARHRALRPGRARRPRPARHRRSGDRRGAHLLEARADRLRHRLDPHGLDRRPEGRRALRPPDPRARRQQRDDRRALGRSRHGGPGDRLFRRRHGGTALHLAAPGHRPSFDSRRSHAPAGQDLCGPADRRSAHGRARWSAR